MERFDLHNYSTYEALPVEMQDQFREVETGFVYAGVAELSQRVHEEALIMNNIQSAGRCIEQQRIKADGLIGATQLEIMFADTEAERQVLRTAGMTLFSHVKALDRADPLVLGLLEAYGEVLPVDETYVGELIGLTAQLTDMKAAAAHIMDVRDVEVTGMLAARQGLLARRGERGLWAS